MGRVDKCFQHPGGRLRDHFGGKVKLAEVNTVCLRYKYGEVR